MGRELRRVRPNWQHPKTDSGEYQPMFNRSYIESISEWIEQHQLWEAGKHPDQINGSGKEYRYYAELDGNAPKVEYYRPDWNPDEMTWYQVYETVSEGTPVTPPFATREELVEYLVENGDFWDQKRRSKSLNSFLGYSAIKCDPWARKDAESFVFGSGWAPSFVVEDGRLMSGVETMANDEQST